MASKTNSFIKIGLPENRGEITIHEVLNEPAGDNRSLKIMEWRKSGLDRIRRSA